MIDPVNDLKQPYRRPHSGEARPCALRNGGAPNRHRCAGVVDRRRVGAGMMPALALTLAACAPASDPPSLGEPSLLAVSAADGAGQPHLAVGPGGEAVLSWLEPDGGGGHALRFATLAAGGWSEPRTVTSGEDLFANWADLPSVVPITADVWVAHWLQSTPGSLASYDIAYAISDDGGTRFEDLGLLNADGVLTEHGFASLFPWGDTIGAVWLDGRLMAEQFESGVFDPEGPPVGVSLRYARIGLDGAVQARGELDELVCECCSTGAAISASGPVIAYRDRSADEIRDIAVLRHTDDGWQGPVRLGPDAWRIEGCPVNGPAVAADGEAVVAAWFTAAAPGPRVRFARSADGGATFGEAIEIDAAGAFGQTGVVLLDGGHAAVSWWRRGSNGLALAARTVAPDGALGPIAVIGTNDVAQPIDVPQMVASGGRLVLAWTDSSTGRIVSAEVPLQ